MRKYLRALWNVVTFPFRLIWWVITLPFRAVRNFLLFLRKQPNEQPISEIFVGLVQEDDVRKAFIEHVEKFRRHLLRSVLWLILGVVLAFAFTQQMVGFLAGPIGGITQLKAIEVTESIAVFMRVALMLGVAVALPFIFTEFWVFIAPGLRPVEKVASLIAIPMAVVLFIGGMAFAYYVMLPTALPVLLNFLGIQAELRPNSYFAFVTNLMFWIGVAFEFPIVIAALTAVHLVKPKVLQEQWRLAIVLIAVLAAVITPTVDPVNMALVMIPTTGLYLISILLSYGVVFIQDRYFAKNE